MNKSTVESIKAREKAKLVERAKILIEKMEASGLKQGFVASEIDVSDQTLSKFKALHPDYVTKRMCEALTKFFESREN